MLKKSSSFVLASLRGSTYRSVRLASSLAAALLGELFEHPADLQVLSPCVLSQQRETELLRKLLMGKTTQSGGHAYRLSQPGYRPCR